jgi:hypothetical protein
MRFSVKIFSFFFLRRVTAKASLDLNDPPLGSSVPVAFAYYRKDAYLFLVSQPLISQR